MSSSINRIIPPSPSIERATLAILINELPDPDVFLFIQPLPEFGTFTLFPKLAPELRLMILEFTLKPRKVKLERRNPDLSAPDSIHVLRCYNSPPVCLQLNRESRHCGLKHYQIILMDDKHVECVKYFNPEIDSLHLDTSGSRLIDIHLLLPRKKFLRVAMNMARVIVLEKHWMVDVFQSGNMGASLVWSGYGKLLKRILKPKWFGNLTTLQYRVHPKQAKKLRDEQWTAGFAGLQSCMNQLKEELKEEVPGYKVPIIGPYT